MPEVLITHPRLIPEGPHQPILREAGFEIRLPPPDVDTMRAEVLAELVGDAEAAIAGMEPYNRAVLDGAPHLRVIARCGVGYESVDVAACDERAIAVTTTPGTNHHSVAEHALAMMLALSRGFPQRDLVVRRSQPWKKVSLPRFAGSTVGIIGLGRIGRALAMRLPGLQVTALAYEPFPDEEFVQKHNVELTGLEELLRRSDYISLHVPVTPETQGLINRETLANMKRSAILVNTARGALIDEDALLDALSSGQLAGAGLDVLQQEPPSADHPLLQQDNVLFSPHAAGMDTQSHRDSCIMVANTLVHLHQGPWPVDCAVNLKGVTDWKWDEPKV
jgi:phosphoglycerate dehydrogenase-like enzyme